MIVFWFFDTLCPSARYQLVVNYIVGGAYCTKYTYLTIYKKSIVKHKKKNKRKIACSFFVFEIIAAGFMAGTVPTKGTLGKTSEEIISICREYSAVINKEIYKYVKSSFRHRCR